MLVTTLDSGWSWCEGPYWPTPRILSSPWPSLGPSLPIGKRTPWPLVNHHPVDGTGCPLGACMGQGKSITISRHNGMPCRRPVLHGNSTGTLCRGTMPSYTAPPSRIVKWRKWLALPPHLRGTSSSYCKPISRCQTAMPCQWWNG